eukprot:756638-Hanusia_phi.AAC.2
MSLRSCSSIPSVTLARSCDCCCNVRSIPQILPPPLTASSSSHLPSVSSGGARTGCAVSSRACGCAGGTLIVPATKRGAAPVAGSTRRGGGKAKVGRDAVGGGEA